MLTAALALKLVRGHRCRFLGRRRQSRRPAAATPRFRQYCAKFREAWAAEAAPDPAASALDDEVAQPSLLDTGQFVTRHAGAFRLTARPFWDVREFPWLEPLVEAAPAMAAELEAAGDAGRGLAQGAAADVFFEDGTSDAGTIDGVDASTCDVRYADDEVERLDRSHVAPRGSAWLRRLARAVPLAPGPGGDGLRALFGGARSPAPSCVEINQYRDNIASMARAPKFDFHIGAEKGAFTATRTALRACRDRLPPATGRFHQYGSPRFVGTRATAPRRAGGALGSSGTGASRPTCPSRCRRRRGPARASTRLHARSAGRRRAAAHALGRRRRRLRPRDLRRCALGRRGERAGRGAAGMIVAGEARPWTEPLVFDVLRPRAYNDGDAPADYLHADFYHPEAH